jgi:predicted nucleic acid-binding protein
MIIADSSALVALSSCQSLWVLNKLFGEIKVPTAVFNEIIIPGKPQAHALRIYLEPKNGN